MYEREKITLVDKWGFEKDAELIYGPSVALMVVPKTENFVEILPMRRLNNRITWGYDEGKRLVHKDELEAAFKRGTLHELMQWNIEHEGTGAV